MFWSCITMYFFYQILVAFNKVTIISGMTLPTKTYIIKFNEVYPWISVFTKLKTNKYNNICYFCALFLFPWYCLSFDLQLLITTSISSNIYYTTGLFDFWCLTATLAIIGRWLLYGSLKVIKLQPRFKVWSISYLHVLFHSS